MFLFKSHKKFSHKQSSIVGFVLAIISILSSVIIATVIPLVMILLQRAGIFHLDIFLTSLGVTLFFSVQGLLLFGFPLFYAQDKKSHMTGFQILIYTWFWMIIIAAVIILASLSLSQGVASLV